jgi:hypothetical protein
MGTAGAGVDVLLVMAADAGCATGVSAADAGCAAGVSVGVMQVKNLLPDDAVEAGALPRPRNRYVGQTGKVRLYARK